MRHLVLAGFALLTWPAAAATEEAGLGTAMLHRPMDAWAPAPVVLLAPGPSLWDPMAARLREALLAGGLAVLEPLTEEPDLLALEPDQRHHPRLDPARIAVLDLGPEGLRAHLWLGCGDLRATLVAGGEATTPRQPE